MENVELNIKFRGGTKEIKTIKAESLEGVKAECRWIMKIGLKIESISFIAYGFKYIIEKF